MTAPDCIAYIEYVSGTALRYPSFGCHRLQLTIFASSYAELES